MNVKNRATPKISVASLAQDCEDFKAGRVKFRTWTVDQASGKRTMSYKGIGDVRQEKAELLKSLRSRDLGMSQRQLARAIHVSTRTLQGWEIGRSQAPEPVLILLELLRDVPEVRRRLVAA